MGRMRLDGRALAAEALEGHAAPRDPQAGRSRQKRKPPRHRDQHRFEGAGAGFGPIVPKADQEEGADRRDLPKHVQGQQVVGQDHAKHRPHEQENVSVKAAEVLFPSR